MPPKTMSLHKMRKDARAIFNAALAAVSSETSVRKHLKIRHGQLIAGECSIDLSKVRDIFVVGAGKASAAMARAVESILSDRISRGVVNVKYGHSLRLDKIRLVEAGHPVPDENGRHGAEDILSLVSGAGRHDLIICLISGGGSALLSVPAPGLTLAQKQATTQVLLACGATIHEINTVRKHLSAIKGGRLAKAAFPARMIALILSDVVGDDPDVIASGPTVPDGSTFADCMAVIEKYQLHKKLPDTVLSHFRKGAAGLLPETPKPGERFLKNTMNIIVGSNREAILAARRRARELGYRPLILSSMIQGETREVARVHAAIAMEVLESGNPIKPPACILSGGETTVTLRGPGKGGRNQEFILATALDIDGSNGIVVFSAGTDGTDGPTDAAGAVADAKTVRRARKLGMDPRESLGRNDAYPFFEKLDDLVVTGPTHTNVMDLRIMLIS